MPPGRIYIGNLSTRCNDRDIEDIFHKYGRINRVNIKNGFAFVEFDDDRDADDAVYGMDGRDIEGRRVSVQIAKGRREGGGAGGGRPRGGKGGYRVIVENMDNRTSWQDLKDFARSAGNVAYTDVWMDKGKKMGVIEYTSEEDMKRALRTLDDTKLDDVYVRLEPEQKEKPDYMRRSKSRSRSRSRGRSRSRSRDRKDKKKDKRRSRSRSRSRSKSPAKKTDKDEPKKEAKKDAKKEEKDAKKDTSRSRSRSRGKSKSRSRSR